jgi:hypothetical protein
MIVASVETDRHKARCAIECVGLGFKLGANFVVLVCPSNIILLVWPLPLPSVSYPWTVCYAEQLSSDTPVKLVTCFRRFNTQRWQLI